MHYRDAENYALFSAFVSANPKANNRDAIANVMVASRGTANPEVITDWFEQWTILRRYIGSWDRVVNL
jgi:hypothetical protein